MAGAIAHFDVDSPSTSTGATGVLDAGDVTMGTKSADCGADSHSDAIARPRCVELETTSTRVGGNRL